MNDLQRYFAQRDGRLVHKLMHYLDIYDGTSRRTSLAVDEYTRTIGGMHVYNSIIAFDKATVVAPVDRTAEF
jgi:hypothetical protein